MKPVEMTKISVTGSKNQLQSVINTLYRLELMDLDEYQGQLEKGDPFEEAEELSETLVDIRSLLSKLPEVETESKEDFSLQTIQDKLPEMQETVEELRSREEKLDSEIRDLNEKTRFFKRLEGCGLSYSDLEGSQRLEVRVGRLDREVFEDEVDNNRYDIFDCRDASVLIYDSEASEGIESALQEAGEEEFQVPEVDCKGSVENVLEQLKNERRERKKERDSIEDELEEYAEKWRSRLASAENFLSEKVEKAEAPINFATTEKTFIAQGWIPEERYEEMEEELCEAAEGKIHIQREDSEDEPPVKHDNPGPVQPFESLTDLMSVPRYNELDPSFVILLTFPLLFGFMIGDAGYGVTSFLVFLGGYKLIPGARDIFKSLMWASFFTFLFGLAFGDAFGYVIFGHHSQLAAVTGVQFFKEIPLLFHRAEHLSAVLPVAAAFGVFHVNFGYLLGFYNEFTNHGFVEAFLEKGSWILLELSIAAWYYVGWNALPAGQYALTDVMAVLSSGAHVGAPLTVLSIGLLYKGEGIEGVVEIPSLLSNILSYLRILGVSVAAVALAKVVNGMAAPLFQTGSITGIIGGVVVLIVGHTFNTFLKIMEGFLQGIRLHYVEMFDKFYEGGGRKYIPFGTQEIS